MTVSGQKERKKGGGVGDRRRSSGRHRRGRADGEAACLGYHSEGRRGFLTLLSIIRFSGIFLFPFTAPPPSPPLPSYSLLHSTFIHFKLLPPTVMH